MYQILKIVPSKNTVHDLSASSRWLAAFWQALPKSIIRRLFGLQEHISLEIRGESGRIQFQIWVPYPAVGEMAVEQIKAHFPDVEIQPTEEAGSEPAEFASAELVLGMSRDRPLRILKDSEADPMAGVLASISDLSPGDGAMIQILVRPALAPSMEGICFQAILRLMAWAGTTRQARNRLGNMIAAFGQFGAENALRPTRIKVNSGSALRAMRSRHWPLLRLNPSLLTLDELTALYHIPSPEKVRNRYLEFSGARRLPPLTRLATKGVRVGFVSLNGQEKEIRLAPQDLLRHLVLFGSTGTGKSTLLLNIALDLVALGFGVSVMDPHGSLVPSLLGSLPDHRLEDVIVVRFADVAHPVGLNFLTARPGFEFLVVDELVEICRRIYGTEYWGPVLDMVLRHTAYAALEIGGTLVDMARILDDDLYRQSILPRVSNAETRRFLEQLSAFREGIREQKVAPTLHRLQRFLGTPFIRNIVGQRKSAINIRHVMDKSNILLFDLAGIGVNNAQFLGSLLTLLFRQTALSREDTPESERALHFLIMDECSWFISRTVGEMADQVRKFGLGLILAAQRLGQLKPKETREAIFANVGNVICFQMGERDEAVYLERHFNTQELSADEIRSLGRYEIYAQLMQEGVKLPAFWARTPPPPSRYQARDQVEMLVQRSREKYALPRHVVEEAIVLGEKEGRYEEPEKRRRQDIASHFPGSGDHPGGSPAWADDSGADPKALLPERW
ncbi:MAG: ATP-binding protein [Chloroflexi bacterium]|nr:ATP-binding protein [Chloroflexota bacterium]